MFGESEDVSIYVKEAFDISFNNRDIESLEQRYRDIQSVFYIGHSGILQNCMNTFQQTYLIKKKALTKLFILLAGST